jgi:hypothetical protein
MGPLFSKTFGGLSGWYYLRHFLFGLIIPGLAYFAIKDSANPPPFHIYLLCATNSVLYPYARFVYEGITDYILGTNVFYVDAWLLLAWKLLTMFLCWAFAIFIAPVGLAYLYIYHSWQE